MPKLVLNKAQCYVLILIATAAAFYCNRWTIDVAPFDDTYITFHYAQHLGAGEGLTWNHHEQPTEGYTNFLYIVLLSPFSAAGVKLLVVSQVLNTLFLLGTAYLIFELVWRLLATTAASRYSNIAGLLAAVLYLVDPFTWLNAMSGMETTLFAMLLLLSICFALTDLHSSRGYAFACVTLAGLTRPEGFMMGGLLLLYFLIRYPESRKKTLWECFSWFVSPVCLYAIWKLWYFGDLLPNSFYVKVLQEKSRTATEFYGPTYLRHFLRGLFYLLPFVIAVFFHKSLRVKLIPIAGWCILLCGFYLTATLLQPNYFRFVHSVEILLIVLTCCGLALTASRFPVYVLVVVGAFLILFQASYAHTYRGANEWKYRDRTFDSRYPTLAALLHRMPDHEKITIGIADAGMLPYYSGLRSIDLVGLNDNAIARAKTSDQVLDYLAKSKPDILLLAIDLQGIRGDSCYQVVRWGHGLIGKLAPQIPHDPRFARYETSAMMTHQAYSIGFFCNRESPYYYEIRDSLQSFRRQTSIFVEPPKCLY